MNSLDHMGLNTWATISWFLEEILATMRKGHFDFGLVYLDIVKNSRLLDISHFGHSLDETFKKTD